MSNKCACCGSTEKIEAHHVGRRNYSDILVDVCAVCHNYLTIADVYERRWNTADPVYRVGLAILDLLARFSLAIGDVDNMIAARNVARALAPVAGYRFRPGRTVAADPDQADPPLDGQLAALSAIFSQFCGLVDPLLGETVQ